MRKILISMAILTGLSITAFPQKAQLLHFYVEAGTYQRINTPVSVELEGVIKSDTLAFQLYEKVKGTQVEKHSRLNPDMCRGFGGYLTERQIPGRKGNSSSTKTAFRKFRMPLPLKLHRMISS